MNYQLETNDLVIEKGVFEPINKIGWVIFITFPECNCSEEKCAYYYKDGQKIYYCNNCCNDRKECYNLLES